MAKTRWRDVKKCRQNCEINSEADCKISESGVKGAKNFRKRARRKAPFYALERLVAFITDMFMINMPLLYIAVYFVLGGKDAFLENQVAIFACVAIYGAILSAFFAFSGQTPGYRYARLKLVCDESANVRDGVGGAHLGDAKSGASFQNLDSEISESAAKELKNPAFHIAFLRYFLWIISTATIFGLLIAFFRADRKPFYDLACGLKVVKIKPTQNPKN